MKLHNQYCHMIQSQKMNGSSSSNPWTKIIGLGCVNEAVNYSFCANIVLNFEVSSDRNKQYFYQLKRQNFKIDVDKKHCPFDTS